MGETGEGNPNLQQEAEQAREAAIKARGESQGNEDPYAPTQGFDKQTKLIRTTDYRSRENTSSEPNKASEISSEGGPKPLFSAEEMKYLQENGDMSPETKARVKQESDIRAGRARIEFMNMVRNEVLDATFPKLADETIYGIMKAKDEKYRAETNQPSEPDMNIYTQNHIERGTKLYEELSKIPQSEASSDDQSTPPQNS